MDVSSQVRAVAALPLGRESAVPINKEAIDTRVLRTTFGSEEDHVTKH
jgi:hypothetical protein